MANMYNIEGLTYQPSTHMDWFTKAVFGGKLIEKGRITPITGIKKSTLLNLLELTGKMLQADKSNCGWTPEEIAKLSEKELEVKNYKINLEQCIDDLERKRIVWMLSPGAKNSELPDTLEGATMELLANELSSEVETKIFNGDSSVDPDDFDGATKILTDSTEAIKIVGTALTKDNILDEIGKAYEAIPENVLAKAGEIDEETGEGGTLFIAMSFMNLQKVKLALGNVKGKNVVVNPNVSLSGNRIFYMGVELIAVKGIRTNDFIIYDSSNFILGTDLVSDLESIRLGQFPAPNDSKVFIDGRLRLGFTILFENEVVFYSDKNTAPEQVDAAKMSAPVTEFSIDLSESKLKPFVANETNVETLQSWLALEQAKAQPRSGVSTLIQNRIDELTKTE